MPGAGAVGNYRYNSNVNPIAQRIFRVVRHACAWVSACLPLFYAMPVVAQDKCVPAGAWMIPGGARSTAPEVLTRAGRAQVVLLGENHDNADHHRWQLQTMAALSGQRARMVIGFEMFPRRVQPVLDRWVAGEFNEEDFLKAVDWNDVWGVDSSLYMPLFQFARLNRIRMVALNVNRELVRAVGAGGLAAVPTQKRENVSDPAPATPAYIDWLHPIYTAHDGKGGKTLRDDVEFRRFVESQLVWDRALAQALAEEVKRDPDVLAIGVMGMGHIVNGHGVPRQLRDLGIARIDSLLPWDADANCKRFTAGVATAVFGIAASKAAPERPLLGITVETDAGGVRVSAVRKGSIAEAAGLREGDLLTEVGGKLLKSAGEVRAIVVATAPGTWLPLKARRQNETLELLAKFPAKP